MIDWSTRPQDMATVDPVAPKSNALRWADFTFACVGLIGAALVIISYIWRL